MKCEDSDQEKVKIFKQLSKFRMHNMDGYARTSIQETRMQNQILPSPSNIIYSFISTSNHTHQVLLLFLWLLFMSVWFNIYVPQLIILYIHA